MKKTAGFTLIELLIVIAIILILISIALPNFLEAQTRAKVTRAEADIRNLATAIEFFRTEHAHYPVGTDNPEAVPTPVKDLFESYGEYAFYTFRTVFSGDAAATLGFYNLPDNTPVGVVPGLTTPNPYIESLPTDPFTTVPGYITYSYREDRDQPVYGWVLTSFGPDMDEGENPGKSASSEAARTPLLPLADARASGRNGDISERGAHPGSDASGFTGGPKVPRGLLEDQLLQLAYSPTNGTKSEGDIYRTGP
ncbi:MAG: prepilin-type N-terminal cleavage/methylation domain-containing protein [Candidatus Omnitrophica bacterium]|nr:prepilin-type N-terminal cleavage/methylation domain-containing protein [Candidatus Omnitrophota bacterium]